MTVFLFNPFPSTIIFIQTLFFNGKRVHLLISLREIGTSDGLIGSKFNSVTIFYFSSQMLHLIK